MMKWIAFLILLFVASLASAGGVVNVYNFGGYIPGNVLDLFTKETGIKVNYSTYDSNQELYIKLKTNPYNGYDVVVPSQEYVEPMVQQGMLHVVDHAKLSHFNNLQRFILNKSFDPNNRYSIPFAWGTTGIVVNDRYYNPLTIKNWSDLWQKRFQGQLLMIDDVRDVFAIAFISLGYSINDENPQHIKQAYLRLQKLLPNIKLYDADSAQQVYCDGDASAGMAENSDASWASQCNSHVHYLYPADGPVGFVDSMVIPKNAPNLQNAYRFINFILQPKVALMIVHYNGASMPNKGILALMTAAERHNRITNPTSKDLKRMQFEGELTPQAKALYLHYWELLKLAG